MNFKIYKKLNIELFFVFFKIFKNIKIKVYGYDIKLIFKKKDILNYLFILKKNSSFLFNMLIDLVIEDFPKKKNRFVAKYFLRSINYSKIIQITLNIQNSKPIYSLINLYKSAFWLEREVWDMYGIFFLLHKDLRRLLTDYGFNGNPFKKDYPLIGFSDLHFDFLLQKFTYKRIVLNQKKHNFYINNIVS